MKNTCSRNIGVCLLGGLLAFGTACAHQQWVVDARTPDGPARRVIRLVESVEAAGTTTLTVADEKSPEQAAYAPLFDAFGELSPRVCTVTHLGQGVVLTAGHCLEDPPPDSIPRFPLVTDDDSCVARVDGAQERMSVRWGRRYGRLAYLQSDCARIIAREWDDNRDFAILVISPSAGNLPRAAAQMSAAQAAQGGGITLFSYPKAMALRWSGVCKLGDPTGSQIPYFFHTCSTDGGSSGAAVIDASSLKIVGFHLGQWGLKGPNYAMYLSDPVVAEQIQRAFAYAGARDVAPAPRGARPTAPAL